MTSIYDFNITISHGDPILNISDKPEASSSVAIPPETLKETLKKIHSTRGDFFVRKAVFEKSVHNILGDDSSAPPIVKITNAIVLKALNLAMDEAEISKILKIGVNINKLEKDISSLKSKTAGELDPKLMETLFMAITELDKSIDSLTIGGDVVQLKNQFNQLKHQFCLLLLPANLKDSVSILQKSVDDLTANLKSFPLSETDQKNLIALIENLSKFEKEILSLGLPKDDFINKHLLNQIKTALSQCETLLTRSTKVKAFDASADLGNAYTQGATAIRQLQSKGKLVRARKGNINKVFIEKPGVFKKGHSEFADQEESDAQQIMNILLPGGFASAFKFKDLSAKRLGLETSADHIATLRGYTSQDPLILSGRLRDGIVARITDPVIREHSREFSNNLTIFAYYSKLRYQYFKDSVWNTVNFKEIPTLFNNRTIAKTTLFQLVGGEAGLAGGLEFQKYYETHADFRKAYKFETTAFQLYLDRLAAEKKVEKFSKLKYLFRNNASEGWQEISFTKLQEYFQKEKIDPKSKVKEPERIKEGMQAKLSIDDPTIIFDELFSALTFDPKEKLKMPDFFSYIPDITELPANLPELLDKCNHMSWMYFDGYWRVTTFHDLQSLWNRNIIDRNTIIKQTSPQFKLEDVSPEQQLQDWVYYDGGRFTPMTKDQWSRLPRTAIIHQRSEAHLADLTLQPIEDILNADMNKVYKQCEQVIWHVQVGSDVKEVTFKELQHFWLRKEININSRVSQEWKISAKNFNAEKLEKEGCQVLLEEGGEWKPKRVKDLKNLIDDGKVAPDTKIKIYSSPTEIGNVTSPLLLKALNVTWKMTVPLVYESSTVGLEPVTEATAKPFVNMALVSDLQNNPDYLEFTLRRLSPKSEAALLLTGVQGCLDLHASNIGITTDITLSEYRALKASFPAVDEGLDVIEEHQKNLSQCKFSYLGRSDLTLQQLQEDFHAKRIDAKTNITLVSNIPRTTTFDHNLNLESACFDNDDSPETIKSFDHLRFSYAGREKVSFAQVLKDYRANLINEFIEVTEHFITPLSLPLENIPSVLISLELPLQKALKRNAEVVLFDTDQILPEGKGWQASHNQYETGAREIEYIFPLRTAVLFFKYKDAPIAPEALRLILEGASEKSREELTNWIDRKDDVLIRRYLGKNHPVLEEFLKNELAKEEYSYRDHLTKGEKITRNKLSKNFSENVSKLSIPENARFWESLQNEMTSYTLTDTDLSLPGGAKKSEEEIWKIILKKCKKKLTVKELADLNKGATFTAGAKIVMPSPYSVSLNGVDPASEKLRKRIAKQLFPRLTFHQKQGLLENQSNLVKYLGHFTKIDNIKIELNLVDLENPSSRAGCAKLLQDKLDQIKALLADPLTPLSTLQKTVVLKLIEDKVEQPLAALTAAEFTAKLPPLYKEAQNIFEINFKAMCRPSQFNAYKAMYPGLAELVALNISLALKDTVQANEGIGYFPVEWLIEAGKEKGLGSDAYLNAEAFEKRLEAEKKAPPSRVRYVNYAKKLDEVNAFRTRMGIKLLRALPP